MMATTFPDVSSWNAGLVLQPGTVAVVAKATEGTGFTDPNYLDFKLQATRVAAILSAYHFLHQGNGAAQADHAFAVVGPFVPLMLDVEPELTIGSRPTVADCQQFIARYRQLGGRVWATYFPRWYWQEVGGDLAGLGTALIASGYPATGYSDTDPNWNGYGGKTVDVWQYTNAQPYGGKTIDFNAFRGTAQELAALIQGGSTMGDIALSGGYVNEWPDLAGFFAPKFPPGQTVSTEVDAEWANFGSRAAAEYARQCRELEKANGVKLDAIMAAQARQAAPTVDVDALAAALEPHLAVGATADQIAHAAILHLQAVLAAGAAAA